jgi:ABC-type branched-subunit amino acid transport system ATPase component/predicted MFS family arabinose efflux permease
MSIDTAEPTALADPPTALAPPAPPPEDSGRRGVRAVLRDATDYSVVRRSPYGLLPLLVMGGMSFFQNFDSAAFSVAGPDIARDLHISVSDIIGIQTLVGTVAVFATIVAGYYADRTRRVPFLAVGTLLSGLFSAVTGRGRTFAGIAMPRVIDDAADTAAGVPSLSLLADYYPDEVRGKAFAFLGNLGRVGALLAPIVAGYAIVRFGWGSSFIAFGIPLMVMGALSLFLLKEPVRGYFERRASGMSEEHALQEDEPQSFGEAWRATFAVRTLRRLTIGSAFSGAAESIAGLFLTFYLAERYGLDPLERSLVFLPAILARLAGGSIGGSLVDYFTARNPSRVLLLVGVFSLILAPASLIYVLQPPLIVLVVAAVLTGFGGSLIGPASGVVFVRVIPPAIRTQGIQVTALAGLPTTILLLPLARQIFRDYDYEGVFLFTIPLAIVGALIAISAASFYELDMRNALLQATAAERFRRQKAAGTTKLLVARGLDVHYGDVQVLFDVDLEIQEGEILALLGTNGAGKSTVLRALSGTAPVSGGGIVFDGRDITRMPPHEIAARGIVQMPGGKGVFPGLSVRDNLLLATWLLDDAADKHARVAEVLEIFPNLLDRADTNAGDLSGGQQQQLSLAQAFLARPKLLLIDELSLGLSPVVVGQLIEVVKEINRRGVTIVVVEQSVNVALTIADRAIFMEKGEIRFNGPTAELLARPDILRAVYVKGTGALTAGASAPARRIDTADTRSILEVDGLVKRYGGITAVDDVSFSVAEGEVLGLIGPNGAGKTTIFELISGHQRVDSGHLQFDGLDITDISSDERARRGLIRRFQDARLFPSLTVYETLLIALEQKLEVRSALLGAFGAPQVRRAEKRVRARADRLLELLELSAHRDKFVKELSTGLRRVLDLACVLATEPTLLLLDEPSSGIAQAEAEGLAPLLRRVKFETGCSILIIEHDMPLISAVSDELIAFDQGHIVTRGTPDEVLNDPTVIESYLGTSEAAVNRSGATR